MPISDTVVSWPATMAQAMLTSSRSESMPAVVGLDQRQQQVVYLGALVVGTAELLVVGVLNLVAHDLQVSIGSAGEFVNAYAVGATGAVIFPPPALWDSGPGNRDTPVPGALSVSRFNADARSRVLATVSGIICGIVLSSVAIQAVSQP